MFEVLIPAALQINMDDVGWWCGRDDRKIGGPSRTGMPRNHYVEDYQAVADLGAELNMQINCAFVLGEWDMENRLGREIPHFSHFGAKWNNASYRKQEDLERAAEIIRNSPHIGVTMHGLYHGYYMPGIDNHDCSDYLYAINGKQHYVPEKEIRLRIEHFLRLCEKYDFRKEIISFIPPSFRHEPFGISEILKEYGIRYIFTHFENLYLDTRNLKEMVFDSVFVEDGIITVDQKYHSIPWDAVDADFAVQPTAYGVLSSHWPNYLNMNPQKYHETRQRIVHYFKKCAETFGIILSRSAAFAATQELYKKYAKTVQNGNTWVIDLSQVPKVPGRLDSFFISAKTSPVSVEGAALGEMENHSGFNNYEVKPLADTVKVFF